MGSAEAKEVIIGLCHKLEADLRKAKEEHPEGGSQDRAVATLGAIKSFLRAVGYDSDLSAPLQHLLHGFNDLSEGFTPPIFQPTERGASATKRPSFEGDQKAVAAAAVTIFKDDAKWDLTLALRTASAAIGVDHKQLREFRRNITRGRAPETAQETYRWFLDKFRKWDGYTPEQRAKKLLDVAKQQKG